MTGSSSVLSAGMTGSSSVVSAGMGASCLYRGTVVHRRTRPALHKLRYDIFMALLDLDELPELARRLRLLSHNRRNLFSFRDSDHGGAEPGGLRAWVDRHLALAGIATGGPIRLLCMPRLLGHTFNPLSVYFCHLTSGELAAILYQVDNTFGERHSYLIPVEDTEPPIRQQCAKELYVSPFMPMEMAYRFRVHPPGEAVAVAISGADADGPVITASFSGRRQPLTDASLLRAFLRTPLLGLKVLAGIHWEALLLWRKGVPLHARPAPPTPDVTWVR